MSQERGRIRITGYDTQSVERRDDLSDWEPELQSEDAKGRLYYAWRRFKSNRAAVFGLSVILLMTLLAIFARPVEIAGTTVQPFSIAPYSPSAHRYDVATQAPSGKYLFGTDWAGRDIFSRVLFGGRWSLSIGFIAVGLAVFVGVPLGAIAGYYGGWIDEAIMRLVDALYAFPFLVLAIAIVAIVGKGYWNMIAALVVVGWLPYARIIRGEILSVKENEYVTAAKALGARDRAVIFRHIVPNAMAPVIVQATLSIGSVVLAAAALGFLGLGLPPSSAEWGSMLSNSQQTLHRGQWWITLFPGLAIFAFVMAINLVGDGVREAFDPQSESGGTEGGFR